MKAPYPPQAALLGGAPKPIPDIPIASVFLVLFVVGAICHMTILRYNLARGHKFIMSGIIFGFCMARISAMCLRIAWAKNPTNISLAIAAQVFVSAGVVLLFVINLLFTQRIIRAQHPHFGWHKALNIIGKLYIASIVVALIALIVCTVQSFYTLSKNTHRIDRDVQLFGSTYFAVSAFLPIPMLIIGLVIPRRVRVDKFGSGHFRTKFYVLFCSAALLTLGSAFRTGIAYKPRPFSNPAWYHSKACFYLFNFTIEIIVVYLYILVRVDKRFHVPDKSHGPGDYSRANLQKGTHEGPNGRANNEEEVFDEASGEHEGADLEKGDLQSGRIPR